MLWQVHLLLVLLVEAVYHAFEQSTRLISQGAGIEVNHKKNGQYKTRDEVQDIIKQECTDIKYGMADLLREHKSNP